MTNVLASSDFEAILNLGKFILASYAALIIVLLVHSLLLASVKVNPITYFKKAFPVLSFAFTSRSSAGALPLNIETQTKALGLSTKQPPILLVALACQLDKMAVLVCIRRC